ncbi:MAG: septal ring lytic transglycosylase RlpA family protein [Deltaproteobacteria bacterium]|nr:septal ring lytic transglycosylase RlpA family protein [Deltaproteobacteria bacterium]
MPYPVQKGDTIAKLTSLMKIRWETFRRRNPHDAGRSSRTGRWFLKEGPVIQGGETFESLLHQNKAPGKHTPTMADASSSVRWIEYTIKPGDTLWALAVKRFHVHVEDLIRDNGIEDPHRLQPGQKIRVRHPSNFRQQEAAAIKEGAAIQGGVSFESSLHQNAVSDKHIPTMADASSSGRWIEYTIKPGDTLWALAVKRFHVHVEDLIRDNGIEDPHRLQPGQRIRVRLPSNFRQQEVVASWYGRAHHGKPMANGELFNMFAATIAHKDLPLGTRVELENPITGQRAKAVITDRGPYVAGRDVDISYGLARKLSLVEKGVGSLVMRVLE